MLKSRFIPSEAVKPVAAKVVRLRSLAFASLFSLCPEAWSQAYEPMLPQTVATDATGYFPTMTEDVLLRGAYDARSLGIDGMIVDGPDTLGQTASDIFPYSEPQPDFYGRNRGFFRPLNKVLGTFTPHDALTMESNRLQNVVFTADADLSLLTRAFEPELAHIKAGPLYFDVLWLGAGVYFSDYNGRHELNPVTTDNDGNGDGWTGFVELGVRGLIRFTDSIYISTVANVIYLPFENELGIGFGNSEYAGILTRLNINHVAAGWELLFYDEFQGRPGINFYPDADAPAFDQSGRYSFGFLDNRSAGLYNSGFVYFVNSVGFLASRAMFDNQWRLNFGIEHADYWQTFHFDNHGKRDWLRLAMQYEGTVIPFAPLLSYEYYSVDGYRSLTHLVQLQLTGRLTENVSWLGMAGYMFNTGDQQENNSFIWEFNLDQTLTRSTHHWLSMGETFLKHEFAPETRTAKYIRYGIDQRIAARLTASAFVQYSENETSTNPQSSFKARDRFGAGFNLSYRPLDFTNILASALYEQNDQHHYDEDTHRWLFRLEVNQQLAHRLTGNVFYQYEEADQTDNPFTEHFFGMSLRRYF